MKAVMAVVLMYAAAAALAVTLTLRNGQKITGEIVRMDDTNVVVQTAAGQKTYAWRLLSNESIKQANPELYERLLARARERQQEQIQTQTQTLAHAGADAGQPAPGAPAEGVRGVPPGIRLGVDTATRLGDSERADSARKRELRKEGWDDETRKTYRGEVRIRIDGVQTPCIYRVRATATLHLKQTMDGTDTKRRTTPVTVKGSSTHGVTNLASAVLVLETAPYYERILTSRSTTGSGKVTIKQRVDYWDISIWINDELVYEAKDDQPPVYHHVQKK